MDNDIEYDYRIEVLADTFAKHAEEAELSFLKNRKKYKEMFPDDLPPEHLEIPFNLSRALSVMAHEIQQLKNLKNMY